MTQQYMIVYTAWKTISTGNVQVQTMLTPAMLARPYHWLSRFPVSLMLSVIALYLAQDVLLEDQYQGRSDGGGVYPPPPTPKKSVQVDF